MLIRCMQELEDVSSHLLKHAVLPSQIGRAGSNRLLRRAQIQSRAHNTCAAQQSRLCWGFASGSDRGGSERAVHQIWRGAGRHAHAAAISLPSAITDFCRMKTSVPTAPIFSPLKCVEQKNGTVLGRQKGSCNQEDCTRDQADAKKRCSADVKVAS